MWNYNVNVMTSKSCAIDVVIANILPDVHLSTLEVEESQRLIPPSFKIELNSIKTSRTFSISHNTSGKAFL